MTVQNPRNPETRSNGLSGMLSRGFTLNWEVAILLIILALAIFTRFYMLGERVMSHDESLHTRFSYNLYADGNFEHTPLMHGPILFHATALSYALFGVNDFSARIYTAVLGVLLVMSPILFRRWLGRWGTIIASGLLLISPLMMYYNRYIRHDTPSMLFAVTMLWAIMMYLSGPPNQRRRAHWLYIIAAAMILNLGSKETAFIYIAIFGVFLAIYWVVRMLQHYANLPGRPIFNFIIIGTLLGGVLSLGMYIILDVVQFDLLPRGDTPTTFAMLAAGQQGAFLMWTMISVAVVLLLILGTLLWVFRDALQRIRWREVAVLIATALVMCLAMVVFEELSHTAPSSAEPVAPAVPGEGIEDTAIPSTLSWLPMIAVWVVAAGAIIFALFNRRRHTSDLDVSEDVALVDGEPVPDGRKQKPRRGFFDAMDIFPEFDLIILIGTLILPWATAAIPYAMKGTTNDYIAFAESLPSFVYNIIFSIAQINTPDQVGQFVVNAMALIPLVAVSVTLGLVWNWRRWLVSAAVFHIIWAFFFTTVFTNIPGLFTGMIQSLGYWLEQQGERRGSQPQYYYLLVVMPFYEFLPVIGAVLAMFAGLIVFWRRRLGMANERFALRRLQQEVQVAEGDEESDPETIAALNTRILATQYEIDEQSRLNEMPFLLFWSWLGVLNLVGYSLAGEKMPWLGTHLTLPLIILTGWFLGRIVDRIDWQMFRQRGWLILLVMPLFVITLLQVIGSIFVGRGPFMGLTQVQLQQTYSWLASVVISGAVLYGVVWLARSVSWRHVRQLTMVTIFSLLAFATFRSAWLASFVNYDYATEFLVYAHAAPAVKRVLNDITELSLRTTDGLDMKFAYDNSVSWPYSWYFRDFTNATFVGENPTVQNLEDAIVVVVGDDKMSDVEPILADRYQRFRYIRMWWPMQEYFYLTPERLANLFDFSPSNTQAATLREGVFDIWWQRDYTTYGQAIDKDFSTTHWPVSDAMYVYVRKDYASQIWEYGVGDGVVDNPLDDIAENVCNTNWQSMIAVQSFTTPNGMTRPVGVTLDEAGNVYVADEYSHDIAVFNATGAFLRTIGQPVGGPDPDAPVFTRPNAVDIGPDGLMYVADTWDYGVDVLTTDGELMVEWGQQGEYGFAAEANPVEGLWGPRDVAVSDEGLVYVSDTGNKRVRVYSILDNQAIYVADIGTGGSGLGELNEPSGLVLHPDGRVFVADTWNRRVAVFMNDGTFVDNYPVLGWYQELGNRPYLALDVERDLLYVTDPDAGRVLVYSISGDCLGSFGMLAGEQPTLAQFGVVGGITVDDDGFVYVADSTLGRVLKFESFDNYRLDAETAGTVNEISADSVNGIESGDASGDDVGAVDEAIDDESMSPSDESGADDEAQTGLDETADDQADGQASGQEESPVEEPIGEDETAE